ncbi:MAG TPA: Na+/H+ antiporter NhaA [Flavihumibacter sp.]|nr:Na+/H+ antiporter NhaA [Flavihumibacter sp.]
MHSGVHATIVGILIAMATPLQSDIDDQTYLHRLTQLSDRFEKTCTARAGHLITSTEQIEIVEEIREISIAAESPLQRLEHNVAPFVNYFVLPLFALSNAGVEIKIDSLAGIVSPLGAGIGLGLILGKFIGVAGTAFLVVALKWAELPRQVNRLHLIGIGLLAGIGFTMSIFITELSLADLQQKSTAKLTILIALVISALLGYWTLRQSRPVPG